MRATIKDVAREANVSPATVSLIINKKPVSISQPTKARVYEAIKKLNYHPNQLAVSLVTSTTNTIGLLTPDSSNPYSASLSHRIRAQFLKKGITVIEGNTDYDPETAKKYLHVFSDHHVDGLIVSQLDFKYSDDSEECSRIIDEMGVPVVSYGRNANSDRKISTVAVDQVQIGYLATRHLLDLGHRRIGCAAGNMHLDVCQLRYRGYLKALSEFGIEEDKNLLFSGDFSIKGGINALPFLLGQNATAIFAFSDMIAYGIYKECKNYHVLIPKDLSVVAVDDLAFSDIIDPPLTTIAQPINEIATSLVDTMTALIQNRKVQSDILLSSHLKARGSTSVPAMK